MIKEELPAQPSASPVVLLALYRDVTCIAYDSGGSV